MRLKTRVVVCGKKLVKQRDEAGAGPDDDAVTQRVTRLHAMIEASHEPARLAPTLTCHQSRTQEHVQRS
eukprot:1849002-Rhodomonas_salina.1